MLKPPDSARDGFTEAMPSQKWFDPQDFAEALQFARAGFSPASEPFMPTPANEK